MKEYQKPSVEFILLAAQEELAQTGSGAIGSMGNTENPWAENN